MPSQAYRALSELVFGGPVIAARPMSTAPPSTTAVAARRGTNRSSTTAITKTAQAIRVQATNAW
jgi:hypothetical protein